MSREFNRTASNSVISQSPWPQFQSLLLSGTKRAEKQTHFLPAEEAVAAAQSLPGTHSPELSSSCSHSKHLRPSTPESQACSEPPRGPRRSLEGIYGDLSALDTRSWPVREDQMKKEDSGFRAPLTPPESQSSARGPRVTNLSCTSEPPGAFEA